MRRKWFWVESGRLCRASRHSTTLRQRSSRRVINKLRAPVPVRAQRRWIRDSLALLLRDSLGDTFRWIAGIPLLFNIRTQNVSIADWHEVTFSSKYLPFYISNSLWLQCGIRGINLFCSPFCSLLSLLSGMGGGGMGGGGGGPPPTGTSSCGGIATTSAGGLVSSAVASAPPRVSGPNSLGESGEAPW